MTPERDPTDDRLHYEVAFLPSAARQFEQLPLVGRRPVATAIDGLTTEPRPAGAKLLSGTSDERIWRLAVGEFRILYQVTDAALIVLIIRVANRREVYNSTTIKRLLKQLRGTR